MSETGHAAVTNPIIAQSFGFKQLLGDIDQRAMGRAYRVIGRDIRPQSTGQFLVQPDSVGDPTGMFLWIPSIPPVSGIPGIPFLLPGSRPISTWRHAFPVITAIGAGGRVNIPRGGNGPVDENFLLSAGKDDTQAFPVFNEAWSRDIRMAYELPSFHPCWPKIPGGAAGIILDTMQEDRQRALYFHADPRLIAVNFAGSPDYSSRVFDLNKDNEFDCDRWAPLHSMMRVVTVPGPNWLAWQIGDTGKDSPFTGRGVVYEH